jgi:hypothetical protein
VPGHDDIHDMGLIKGLHHLDAIARSTREEHGVVDGGPESAGFIDSNGGAGRQHLGRDQLRRHCARRGGSLRNAANCASARSLEGALRVGRCGKRGKQSAYPNGAKSIALSCHGRRACC